MSIIILFVCFISIFLCLGISGKIKSKKELLISSVLIFSAILVSITELLSLLHRLNYQFVFISWAIITFVLIFYMYLNNKKARHFVTSLKPDLKEKLTGLTKLQKALLIASAIILLLIFIQALLYPPNNWDAMTYHMARITSWISHQSLSHYPTDITRQLYQPPFAECVVMNFGILIHSDIFSNTVQYFFLLFSAITIVSLIETFGLNQQYKIIGVALGITIPEVTLQASSTQNDIVVAFFIIITFLFVIKTIKEQRLSNFVFIGLATGLGVLTKGTAYIYLPPILLLLGIIVLIQLFKTKNYQYLWYPLIAVFLVAGLNAGHYSRNYKLTHNFLGVDKAESKLYSNQKMNAGLLLSNIIKNAGLHTGIMYIKPAAAFTNKAIYKFHQIVGIDINDTATNYRNIKYSAITPTTDEEGSPTPFHFLFIAFSVLLIIYGFFKGKPDINITALLVVIVVQVIFFCFYLKWQPWHSRLHIPLFLMSVPLICYCLSINLWFRRLFFVTLPIILIYTLMVVLHTERRPYSNTLFQNRYQKYFIGNPPSYEEYNAVNKSIQTSDYKNIGLILGEDSWEYPLFTQCFNKEINPVYIKVNNFSKNAVINSIKVDCIISTVINSPFIDFKGRRFANKNSKNKIVWLYE
jgi:4-amino-4-deoxy-L-arabinose transferase-like glycosyltransferase